MKQLLVLLTLFAASGLACEAQSTKNAVSRSSVKQPEPECDTIYYDKEWKGVSGKAFATYYRIIPHNLNGGGRRIFRDYFMTGELQCEGEFISIDRNDDENSRFEGRHKTFLRNGNVESEQEYHDGVRSGVNTFYYENGLVQSTCNYVDGKMDGILTEFTEQGDQCIQIPYTMGKPTYDYYVLSNNLGYVSKFRLSDRSPVYESPDVSERKTTYVKGVAWPYYEKNGICLAQTNTEVSDYGKYYQIKIYLVNNSMLPIQFDPALISATLTRKDGKSMKAQVLSAEEYMKKVERRQNMAMAFAGIAAGLSAAAAGYSTATTNTMVSGYGSTYGTASAYGTGGYASGSYYGNSSYSGNVTSTTITYDAAAAYQARMMATNQLVSMGNAQMDARKAKDEGYLKRTTVYPGQAISGYVNIKRQKGKTLEVTVCIDGVNYVYNWNVDKT